MIQQGTENTVSPENGSEYQVACRAQAFDVMLASVSHLFCFVTTSGILQTMTGISKDFNFIQFDPEKEKDSVFGHGKPPQENCAGRYSSSQPFQGLSLHSVMPWLWGDVKAFLTGSAERAALIRRVSVLGGYVDYHIRLFRVVSTDGAAAGAILSIPAPSEIGREARERQKLELLGETFQEIRQFCHDFSQPLMVLSGYLELMNLAPSGDSKYLRKSQVEGLEREIHKLNGIYQKLRDAVLHCRKQLDLTDTPPTA